ncbi:MAG: DUF1924 domain-containing protein [Rhizobiales bacterium]|nr:DUF1924 domain-containing protein [Hyphomicrobiales bacterium]
MTSRLLFVALLIPAIGVAALASAGRDGIVSALSAQAKQDNSKFTSFSAEAGKKFWFTAHVGGKSDTPSCVTCHTKDARTMGQTRAGKAIDPMAVSANPNRFTDPEKVAKWFGRNCNTVLGRECTAEEKGNVITYLMSQ